MDSSTIDLQALIEDLTTFSSSLLWGVGSIEDAEDIVSEAMTITFKSPPPLQFLRQSLFITVRFLCNNWKKLHENRPELQVRIDDPALKGSILLVSAENQPQTFSEIQAVMSKVAEGDCRLKPRCSNSCVLLLFAALEMNLEEIAGILQLPKSTVGDYLRACRECALLLYRVDKSSQPPTQN